MSRAPHSNAFPPIVMHRSFATASLLVALSLGAASVARAQRPVGRPADDDAKPKRPPAANAGHSGNPHSDTGTPTIPASGKYRVTLVGFRVNHETYDTPLETDGKGDEIRLSTSVQQLGPNGEAVGAARTLTTPVYGDVNNFRSRVQAGSRSDKGGLKTGDTYPANADPAVRHEEPRTDRLPLLLWQGELQTGKSGVAIAPTVWEVDSGDVLTAPLLGGMAGSAIGLAKTAGIIGPIASLLPGTGLLGKATTAMAGIAANIAGTVKQFGNRPVGTTTAGSNLQYAPQVVILTTGTAEAVLAGKAGIRPGVIEVRYHDSPGLDGDYSLYLQVERIP